MSVNIPSKFFTHCVPARTLIAAGIYYTPSEYMPYWIAPAAIAGAAGAYRYLTYDSEQTGTEGQNVWWNNNRFIHIILTFIFIILVIQKNNSYAKIIPIIDIIYGIGSVYLHYS